MALASLPGTMLSVAHAPLAARGSSMALLRKASSFALFSRFESSSRCTYMSEVMPMERAGLRRLRFAFPDRYRGQSVPDRSDPARTRRHPLDGPAWRTRHGQKPSPRPMCSRLCIGRLALLANSRLADFDPLGAEQHPEDANRRG